MIDYMMSFEFTSFLALWVYWIPLTICLTVYMFRTIALYQRDLDSCEKRHYRPELTIGVITWMFICAITPAVNLFALVFDCASSVFKWMSVVFDIALVPRRNTEE